MAIPFLKSKPPARGRADDPLALFEAESEFSLHDGSLEDSAEIVSPEGAGDPRPASGRTSGVLTLETVLGRGTPVFWPEAVAIIEATCTALVTAEGTELPAPEPSDILLTAEGIIQVRGGGRRADSVQLAVEQRRHRQGHHDADGHAGGGKPGRLHHDHPQQL